jgi:hypothetical protein
LTASRIFTAIAFRLYKGYKYVRETIFWHVKFLNPLSDSGYVGNWRKSERVYSYSFPHFLHPMRPETNLGKETKSPRCLGLMWNSPTIIAQSQSGFLHSTPYETRSDIVTSTVPVIDPSPLARNGRGEPSNLNEKKTDV